MKKTTRRRPPAKKAAAPKKDVACLYCGRRAVGRNEKGAAVCATHKGREEARGRTVGKL